MRSRIIAIAGSIAALSFTAAPIAQAASPTHHDRSRVERVDRSRDARGVRHLDAKSVDTRSAGTPHDR